MMYTTANLVNHLQEENKQLLEALKWAMNVSNIRYYSRNKMNEDHCKKIDEVNALIAKSTGAKE